jgi:ubiquinone/menaquinone biosynthesis C-methylase UbiE
MNSPTNSPASNESFEQASYAAHAKEYTVHVVDGQISEHAQSWYRTDTVGAGIGLRIRNSLAPLLLAFPEAKWLTVGDGGLGNDAHYLLQHGADALATDISTELLAEAKRSGYIKEYGRENAEKLSFSDGSFDFVLCKEAYHHFPRPYLALYEMLRVARQGVVLIEPNDAWIGGLVLGPLSRKLFSGVRRLLGKQTSKHGYEESGNYQYTLSVREMEKVALGMNFPAIAHRHLNSFYRQGVEFAPAGWKAQHALFVQSRVSLWVKNVLSALHLIPYGLVAIVVFKRTPTDVAARLLASGGFTLERLPANPYLQSDRE